MLSNKMVTSYCPYCRAPLEKFLDKKYGWHLTCYSAILNFKQPKLDPFLEKIRINYPIGSAGYVILEYLHNFEIENPRNLGLHEKEISTKTGIDIELLQDYLFELSYEGLLYQPRPDCFRLMD